MAGRTEIVEVRICLRERAASRDATVLGTLLFALQYNTAFSKQYRSQKCIPNHWKTLLLRSSLSYTAMKEGPRGVLV